MKKKIISFVIICLMIIPLFGCGKKEKGNISKLEIKKDIVNIEVKKDTLTKTGTTIIMENKSEEKYNYGSIYHLEKKESGKWITVKPINDLNFTMMAYEILPGEKKEIKIDWEYGYGSLKKGTYRLIKTMYQLGNEPIDESKNIYVAAEFKIK